MSNIQVGRFYINEKKIFAREVARIEDEMVLYRNFGYPDGKPIGMGGRCSLYAFGIWAARPLADEEAEEFRAIAAPQRAKEEREFLRVIFDKMPDEMLLNEVRRRKLRLA